MVREDMTGRGQGAGEAAAIFARALAALPPGPLAIAFSAGPDSLALLALAAASPAARARGLRALHVHHGLHADADAWAARAGALAAGLDVPCRVLRVAVPRGGREGLEAAAREARYAALAEALAPGEHLATAHHRRDQAETFVLRALRGSGDEGLAAMAAHRPLGRGALWRPLLGLPRAALAEALAASGLAGAAVVDPSNLDPTLERGWLRSALWPLMDARRPGAEAAFARSAALAAESAGLHAREDARALARVQGLDPCTLDAAAWAALPDARRPRVLRAWWDGLGLPPPPGSALAWCEASAGVVRGDAEHRYRWRHAGRGYALHRWRGLLHAAAEPAPLPGDLDLAWDGRAPLDLPEGARLAFSPAAPAALAGPLRVRARAGGERLVLPGRRHSTPLRHALQDLGVPPWERIALPLLLDAAGAVLAAGDLVLSAPLDAALREAGAGLRWRPPLAGPGADRDAGHAAG